LMLRIALRLRTLCLIVLVILARPAGLALAASTLDQSDLNQTASGPAILPGEAMAQTFTPALTGSLDRVDLVVVRQGTTGNFTVQIRTVDVGGAPTATVLGSGSVPMASLPPSITPPPLPFTSVALTTPVSVVAGTTYAIV
jgi:hypothetical protein